MCEPTGAQGLLSLQSPIDAASPKRGKSMSLWLLLYLLLLPKTAGEKNIGHQARPYNISDSLFVLEPKSAFLESFVSLRVPSACKSRFALRPTHLTDYSPVVVWL